MTTISTVDVAGSGTMGAGIAIVAARAEFRTIVYDLPQAALDRSRMQTEGYFAKSVERNKLTHDQVVKILAGPEAMTDIGTLAQCDVVIEAIGDPADAPAQSAHVAKQRSRVKEDTAAPKHPPER